MLGNSQFPKSAPTHESRVLERKGVAVKMNIRHRPIAKSQEKIRSYAEFRQQIHDDLRSVIKTLRRSSSAEFQASAASVFYPLFYPLVENFEHYLSVRQIMCFFRFTQR